jgi:hypothetical protein
MNLPFGLPTIRENTNKRKDEGSEIALYYERKLAEYRDTLEKYKNCLFEYASRLDGYDKRSMDNQLSIVQTALDLTYLKEQGDKIAEQGDKTNVLLEELKTKSPESDLASNIESLAISVIDANSKLDGLDKNVVNRLSELLIELQKQSVYQNRELQTDLISEVERLRKSVKRGHALNWFLFFFSLLSLSGIAVIGLYIMEIIPF